MSKSSHSSARQRVPGYHRLHREIAKAPMERKRLLELAVNEAEALAWETGVPNLVFLTLAEEKLDLLNDWLRRQQRLRLMTAQWS